MSSWEKGAVPDDITARAHPLNVAIGCGCLAELDEHGWVRFTEDARKAHRADVHQVPAYASLCSADEVIASLVYPLVYRLRSSARWEIIPWVQSFGALAELVAPLNWRAALRANVEAMMTRYAETTA